MKKIFNSFIEKILKKANIPDEVNGPAVDTLISVVNRMLELPPAEAARDETGFQAGHYQNPYIQELGTYSPGQSIPSQLAIKALQIMATYQRRQFPEYKEVYKEISNLISPKTTSTGPVKTNDNDKKIKFLESKIEYGELKHFFLLPGGLDRSLKMAINKVVKPLMEEKYIGGEYKWQQVTNQWGTNWPLYKAYGESRNQLGVIYIHPDFTNAVGEALQQKGFDVSEILAIPVQEKNKENINKKQISANIFQSHDGFKGVSLGFSYDPEIVSFIKNNLSSQNRAWDSATKRWKIFKPSENFKSDFIKFLEDKGYDTSPVSRAFDEISVQEESDASNKKIRINAINVAKETNGEWHIAIRYFNANYEGEHAEYLKEILKYMFPRYQKDDELHEPSDNFDRKGGKLNFGVGPSYAAYIRGEYSDYWNLRNVFIKYNFDTSEYDKIVFELLNNNFLERGRVEGDLEGFQKIHTNRNGTERRENDYNSFYDSLKKYEGIVQKEGREIDFKLYEKQKEGIAFLYGHQSAILGDTTGVGKTIQLILAADMRMQQHGGSTVIVTLNSVQDQFAEEIKNYLKINDDNISFDPLDPRKWIVMNYTNFSRSKQLESQINALKELVKSGQITCFILDELHSVKNDSKRTQNIQDITKFEENGITYSIPFVWGATATVVANKPIDLYNQLKTIGHKFGRMSLKKFKYEFGGRTREEEFENALKLKEWLINYGVYIQRTKKDVREDMPEHNIEEVKVPIDMNMASNWFKTRLNSYKDPNLAISIMLAQRNAMAIAKAPITAQKALSILNTGKKVAIFSCFLDAVEIIQNTIQQSIKSKGQEVVAITGKVTKQLRQNVIKKFKDKNDPAKAIVIMIQAGGTGLDFPNVTNNVLVNDFDWSPKSAEQSEGRFYRINSLEDINTEYVIAQGTVDEKFYAKVSIKRKLAALIQELTSEEMELLQSGTLRTDKKLIKNREEQNKAFKELEEIEKSFEREVQDLVFENKDHIEKTQSKNNWYKKSFRKSFNVQSQKIFRPDATLFLEDEKSIYESFSILMDEIVPTILSITDKNYGEGAYNFWGEKGSHSNFQPEIIGDSIISVDVEDIPLEKRDEIRDFLKIDSFYGQEGEEKEVIISLSKEYEKNIDGRQIYFYRAEI